MSTVLKKGLALSILLIAIFSIPSISKNNNVFETHSISKEENPYPTFIRMLSENMHVQTKAYSAYMQFTVNATTPGYKRYKIVQKRVGDRLVGIQYMDWRKDIPKFSDRKLDVYLSGKNNFLTVLLPNGEHIYTADGRMIRDKNGLLSFIASDYPVLGQQGKIYLPDDFPSITKDGDIYAEGEYVDTIKVTSFNSNEGLFTYDGMHFFVKDSALSKKVPGKGVFIRQGFHEASNELPGMGSQYLILPYLEGTVQASKYLFQSYDHMFRAAGPD